MKCSLSRHALTMSNCRHYRDQLCNERTDSHGADDEAGGSLLQRSFPDAETEARFAGSARGTAFDKGDFADEYV